MAQDYEGLKAKLALGSLIIWVLLQDRS